MYGKESLPGTQLQKDLPDLYTTGLPNALQPVPTGEVFEN